MINREKTGPSFSERTKYFTIFGVIVVLFFTILIYTGIWGFPDFVGNVLYSNLIAGTITLIIGFLILYMFRYIIKNKDKFADWESVPQIQELDGKTYINRASVKKRKSGI